MTKKTISKTDLSKKAVVVTRSMQALLKKFGMKPTLRGDNHEGVQVVVLKNTGKQITLHYYSSERKGAGRVAEPRFWSKEFGKIAKPGQSLSLKIIKALEIEVD